MTPDQKGDPGPKELNFEPKNGMTPDQKDGSGPKDERDLRPDLPRIQGPARSCGLLGVSELPLECPSPAPIAERRGVNNIKNQKQKVNFKFTI